MSNSPTVKAAAANLPGSMNWEPVRKRLLEAELKDALEAATELRENIEIVHSTEFPLMLSALLPAFSSVLAHRTRPTPDTTSVEHQLRHTILELVSKMPANEILRPHAPHLVAVAIDILNRDYEENALLASRIVFDLYKVYRSLPQDYVQPYIDFVIHAYRSLPSAIQLNFAEAKPVTGTTPSAPQPTVEKTPPTVTTSSNSSKTPVDNSMSSLTTGTSTEPTRMSLRSNMSFRVLTECPLMVMLMFQLYPKYVQKNIPVLIRVMMEALALRAPSNSGSRARELVAAQAKTLSFLTYLLRSFSSELKAYEDRLANHVVALMTLCPRESVSTRKELLVATRHLLNSDFRQGFFRHVDVLLEERVLMGCRYAHSLRPLAYTTLSDLVQHVRAKLSMAQMSKVVGIFSRVLHSTSLPLSTHYIAVRTLLSVQDLIYHNTDPDAQLGRDLLVRTLSTMVKRLACLCGYFPVVLVGKQEQQADSIKDIQSMIRAIVVGHKTVLYYLQNYRTQRKDAPATIPAGSNEEVSSARLKLTHTEIQLVDQYIPTALRAISLLLDERAPRTNTDKKTLTEQHRDALTYFASAFTSLDGTTLRRTLGKRLPVLVDAIMDDQAVMVVPRHLLAANPTTSLEFCSLLLEYLMDQMDMMSQPQRNQLFISPVNDDRDAKENVRERVNIRRALPMDSEARLQRKSTTILQLFERVLKSLSSFPENETVVRKQLRRIVSVCLRSSLEHTKSWPDHYCMLLRYVFRSISAGKFEESYRELLPLIPTVLNGLFRVVQVSQDEPVLMHTAIELCLTIPARLSSLLPHLNLLLRIIVPALDSSSGDLVNLGLRTLEFWVDNLNPLFLYPEMSKQIKLFSELMQSLSRHLRPAPYPYGLLTLRLLGKLGGKNREFLRQPMTIANMSELDSSTVTFYYHLSKGENHMDVESDPVELRIPLGRCLRLLRSVANSVDQSEPDETEKTVIPNAEVKEWSERDLLWTCRMADVDFAAYNASVSKSVKDRQAAACFRVAHASLSAEISFRKTADTHSTVMVPIGDPALEDSCTLLLYSCLLESPEEKAWKSLRQWVSTLAPTVLSSSFVRLLCEAPPGVEHVGTEVLKMVFALKDDDFDEALTREDVVDIFLVKICEGYICSSWNKHGAFQSLLLMIVESMDSPWRRKHELRLVNTSFVVFKSIPLELSSASVRAASFAIEISRSIYNVCLATEGDFIWDSLPLSSREALQDKQAAEKSKPLTSKEGEDHSAKPAVVGAKEVGESSILSSREPLSRPCEDVFRIILQDLASMQQLARFTARFVLVNFFIAPFTPEENLSFFKERITVIRRALFSRSLRLMPLPQQVGVVEGLAVMIKEIPGLLPLSDQHFLAFLSELLKMASVADGEMSDKTLANCVVDKNGYVGSKIDSNSSLFPSHASTIFYRRECAVFSKGLRFVVPEELPVGVQLRVSAITLLHSVIRRYTDPFFDAESTTPIGNIRPHVVSLLFRSLVSFPTRAVDAAHRALRDVLALSMVTKPSSEGEKSQSRLPKELLQTCIRPVLLHLRDYTRLSIPLLKGLSRLLSLLSSWFNKTLGEKLLDHLQKWTDPGRIVTHKIWRQGSEPLVAAGIVDIFASLPHASHFVEPLVKTCIKLEATLPAFKAKFVESPYRKPLARYLNRHPQYAANFFFHRLKTPMYSELFQSIVEFPESCDIRAFLSNKQSSVMILNVCFERPLAIIRSEKSASSTQSKPSLSLHGIAQKPGVPETKTPSSPRPMSVDSLELQFQGFRLVNTLLSYQPTYFQEHNDIVRAFRWLWRSKGRFLRLQHEDLVPPRYHPESTMLASFLMAYAKSFPTDDFDILFELIRIFLQPSTSNFQFVGQFLARTVSSVLTIQQKKKIVHRFFALISGESTEETKVLTIQYLILPMLQEKPEESLSKTLKGGQNRIKEATANGIVDDSILEKFTNNVLFHEGSPVACGTRLKVELLKLLQLFVVSTPVLLEPHRKEMVRFCWVLLKSEDAVCKGWAYLVVSRFAEAFDTPAKVVTQVYLALLRSHQQEGKELVRQALDVLVPILTLRLSGEEYTKVVEQTSQLMLEEGNSTPQLAHICQTLVHSPEVFYDSRARFVGYMINSLNRLGLPPNCALESRILAVDITALLLDWEEKKEPTDRIIIPADQVDAIGNFLVRLKILMAEPSDSRHPKIESVGASCIEGRVMALLRRVLTKWDVTVRPTPFEKVASKYKGVEGVLLSSFEIFGVMAVVDRVTFFADHGSLFREITLSGLASAKHSEASRKGLRDLVMRSRHVRSIGSAVMNAIEKVLFESMDELKKNPSRRSSDADASRSRDRQGTTTEDSTNTVSFAAFLLELIAELCEACRSHIRLVSTSLLALGASFTKTHLSEAAAKQRQGSSNAHRASSPGILSHTPTNGILETAFRNEYRNGPRSAPAKWRSLKDTALQGPSSVVLGLTEILTIFEASDLPFFFSTGRKVLFQIISSLLDTSDSVQLLVIATRIAGKWILGDGSGSPITLKERNSLMYKLASLDYTGVTNDLDAQPVADTLYLVSKRFISSQPDLREEDPCRFLVALLLHADLKTRNTVWTYFAGGEKINTALFWQILHADMEGLCGRLWITGLVEVLLMSIPETEQGSVESLRELIQGDPSLCMDLFESLLPAAWDLIPNDGLRLKLARSFEFLLSRPYHAQVLGIVDNHTDKRCTNSIRAFLNGILRVRRIPVLDAELLVVCAESYSSWYEVLCLLETQYFSLKGRQAGESALRAMRHCYQKLDDGGVWKGLAPESCKLPQTVRILSKDVYGMVNEAVKGYADLVDLVDGNKDVEVSDFEMDLWEERWIDLNKDLCQLKVVSEYATSAGSPHLLLECAWKAQDWNKVRSLCASESLLPAVESGDPLVKMSETLLAVADGKLGDVENLHAQTAQLCLYKWQLLPGLCSGSTSHSSLLHFFHRLVEIRESGQIMVETSNHSTGRTLPDLKNLLNAWRHRLPNDWDRLSAWDEIFSWRAHMFTAITSNFHWSDANTLATLHDRPWTVIRMAKTARKQGMRDVSLLLLNKTAEERAMSVSDAFLKLREQILAYFNRESDLERHGGLNLINTTNLSFFDAEQKSELFRLKALFLASLGGRSKANQAYCQSVQICATHARAWNSWGELCASLGAVAEKQAEQRISTTGDTAAVKEAKANAAKKVSQYLAQAMGCYIEAVHLNAHEWARIHVPKCLWMLSKDGPSPGVLCQTLEDRGTMIPAWVWLPWIPQLLTGFYRPEGRAIKVIFSHLVRAYPQAVYYPLRSFYLERRDVERAKNSSSTSSPGQHMGSVSIAEVMMSLLRRSHASLWSALESILEEMIVKFRPSYEEELLSTLIALLERAETQVGSIGKGADEGAVISPVWKTLSRIAVKFFRKTDPSVAKKDERAKKTAEFKENYKEAFEEDFDVKSDSEPSSVVEGKPSFKLEELLERLRKWKDKLETHALSFPPSMSLIDSSHSLAMFGVGDVPDLWPGSCDPHYSGLRKEREIPPGDDNTAASTSSSAAAARKAARIAATVAASAATREGMGGEYGGGSSRVEIPGQYVPNTSDWVDIRPSPELHAKLIKFHPSVEVLRRNDQVVRRIGMVASDGKTYKFLLQFAVPYWTRTDERTSQLHYVLDKVIRKDVGSVRGHLSVQAQVVIPVAQRLRLTCEPDSRTSLEEIYRKHCKREGQDHAKLLREHRDEIKKLHDRLISADSKKEAGDREELEKAGKLAAFKKVAFAKEVEPSALLEHLHCRLKSPETVYQFRRTFAQQWGANCLLQYVLSVMERTPTRVSFVEEDGRVFSPDFRIAYSSQGFIESTTVPFRLTPNIVHAIGFSLMDSCFVTSIARIATAVRACRSDIDPILRLLMRDDLVTFYTKSMAKSDSQTQDMEKQLTDRVSRNVATLHSRFSECCPSYQVSDADKKSSDNPVDQRVRDLIATARSLEALSEMPVNFQGWM